MELKNINIKKLGGLLIIIIALGFFYNNIDKISLKNEVGGFNKYAYSDSDYSDSFEYNYNDPYGYADSSISGSNYGDDSVSTDSYDSVYNNDYDFYYFDSDYSEIFDSGYNNDSFEYNYNDPYNYSDIYYPEYDDSFEYDYNDPYGSYNNIGNDSYYDYNLYNNLYDYNTNQSSLFDDGDYNPYYVAPEKPSPNPGESSWNDSSINWTPWGYGAEKEVNLSETQALMREQEDEIDEFLYGPNKISSPDYIDEAFGLTPEQQQEKEIQIFLGEREQEYTEEEESQIKEFEDLYFEESYENNIESKTPKVKKSWYDPFISWISWW